MGFFNSVVKAVTAPVRVVGKAVGAIFGIDPGRQADAIREAAQQQAQAEIEAANRQAEATKRASQVHVAQANYQAQAAAQAQQAAVNQANLSAQLSAQAQQAPPQTQIDLTSPTTPNSTDPRRKYRGGARSVKDTNGGVGIRLT